MSDREPVIVERVRDRLREPISYANINTDLVVSWRGRRARIYDISMFSVYVVFDGDPKTNTKKFAWKTVGRSHLPFDALAWAEDLVIVR